MNHRPTLDELILAAGDARENAYAPYSQFSVGAALLTDDGSVFTGCNIENMSFGLSICAERTAIAAAIGAGYRTLRKIIVVASPLSTPCGSCRQVMAEFGDSTFEIVAVDVNDHAKRKTWAIGELLPDHFRLEK